MGKPPLTWAIERHLEKNKVDKSLPFMYPKYKFKHEIRFFPVDLFDMIDKGQLKEASEIVYEIYKDAFYNMGIKEKESSNFAMTKDYLFVVPRKQEFFEGVSINSLNFVGTFFAESDNLLRHMESLGPTNMLEAVTKPHII